jgi:hypothetical protein
MNEILLYKKPTKALKIILLSSPFVAIGFWMLDRDNSLYDNFMAYASIIFFGFGILVGLFHLVDRRPQIRIDEKGIWDRTTKREKIDWKFIKTANSIKIHSERFIALKLDEEYEKGIKQYKWAATITEPYGAEKINISISQVSIDLNEFASFIRKMSKLTEVERKEEIKNFKR